MQRDLPLGHRLQGLVGHRRGLVVHRRTASPPSWRAVHERPQTDQRTGRGLNRTKTYINDDLAVCGLRGGFTRVEQTLLEGGHGDDVIRQRTAFEQVMRAVRAGHLHSPNARFPGGHGCNRPLKVSLVKLAANQGASYWLQHA